MNSKLKICVLFVVSIIFLLGTFENFSYAQTDTPTPTPNPSQEKLDELQNQIKDLQSKIFDLQKQQKTLSSQISVMDSQIKLTQLRIKAVKQEIADLTDDIQIATNKISTLEIALDNLTRILIKRIVVTYEVGSIQPMQLLLSSSNVANFFSRANYLKMVQKHDKELIFQTQQTKNDYSNQKDIFEGKKKKVEALKSQLEAYTTQLDQEKKSKQQLLEVTRNDEERYQKLLQEAQAQIQAFKSFATSRGGPSILPAQPSPDGWYYNQRDERWGRSAIGLSREQIWDVGCLVTSTAMVMKKHGSNVTPQDVASSSSYYFSDTAYMLLPWGGGKFSSTWGFDQGTVDGKLSSGEPVIVGVRAGTYGMHFIVLKSGSNGDYKMNDPWYGPDLKFLDYYSTSQIFQYGFYNG